MPWRSFLRVPLLAAAAAALLCGCGAGAHGAGSSSGAVSVPAYVREPATSQQLLIAKGARLFVLDGCSACHSIGSAGVHPGVGPTLAEFAGNEATLADGRHVLVDEAFLRESLLDPRATQLKGYPLAPMLDALAGLHLDRHLADVSALAAFVEEVGPETGS